MKINKQVERLRDLIVTLEGFKNTYPKKESVFLNRSHYYEIPTEEIKKFKIDAHTNLISLFGEDSHFLKYFLRIEYIQGNLEETLGILKSALENFEKGYLEKIEYIVANEIFDNLLEEANYFINNKNNKDIGVMLLRIVLEDNLKRICMSNNIKIKTDKNKDKTLSKLNDDLKESNFYNQTQWRSIQTYLDIGNNAHHGKFEEYSIEDAKNFSNGLEVFIKNYVLTHAS